MDAIRAATYWPAVAMKKDDDDGTVTEGKYADVIAVRGDVLRTSTCSSASTSCQARDALQVGRGPSEPGGGRTGGQAVEALHRRPPHQDQ